MTNRMMMRRAATGGVLAAALAGLLGGCVAAVVPIAAGALGGKSALHRRHRDGGATEVTKTAPVAPSAAPTTSPQAMAVRREAPAKASPPAIVAPPPPAVTAVTAVTASSHDAEPAVAATATNWDAIARALARAAARTPDKQKASVLQFPASAPAAPCGDRPVAVAIDAATLSSADYLYVGAIYTMGYEVVLTARTVPLPAAQTRALAKQGIADRVVGKTLFVASPGAEAIARAAIGRQWCVVGLVGNRAADFPGGALPGTTGARDGWFLVEGATPGRSR